ncbi:60 kDa neurofilament protein [Octopus bimaculoides]|uniref:IF rod domain-containing protein n=1 Tax=Octopus bimaculoides TaxID=37653 RepID=A0A0L8GZ15_OCTBM|nr:60 kDa neurofilament protein [Octopus bimaculoides]|eukprot:XP_014776803.1 PREDICTED: 60 kDa neurofilament protein-like [Octopus bimaculoides]
MTSIGKTSVYKRTRGVNMPHGSVHQRYSRSSATIPLSFQNGVASSISHKGVVDIRSNREKERKEMQDLNERFGNYIERVRFLEAENTALKEALKKSKRDFNIEPIKAMYQAEIDETKKLLDDSTNENGSLKARIGTLEDELDDLRVQLRHLTDVNDQQQSTIETLNDDISRRVADCEMLRRKVQELEKQLADWKARHGNLEGQLHQVRLDLQEETAQRMAETNRAHSLEDELNFLREVSEAEIKEYRALLSKDNSIPDMREYWTTELGNCLKEIRQEFEGQLEGMSAAMEARYQSEMNEMRLGASKGNAESAHMSDENKRLRSQKNDLEAKLLDCQAQIAQLTSQLRALQSEFQSVSADLESEKSEHRADVERLNAELEAMIKELRDLMDAKLSLELEIAAYRKLLEGEENRLSLGSVVQSIGGYQSHSEEALANALQQRASSGFHTPETGKITINRTASGTVSIAEVEPNGKYVQITESSKVGRVRLGMHCCARSNCFLCVIFNSVYNTPFGIVTLLFF